MKRILEFVFYLVFLIKFDDISVLYEFLNNYKKYFLSFLCHPDSKK